VKWVAERSESFLSDAHGRDHVTKIELACEKDGTFIAFRTETMANVGAYLSNFSTVTPTFLQKSSSISNCSFVRRLIRHKRHITNLKSTLIRSPDTSAVSNHVIHSHSESIFVT
jgi:carbon-monoxide dehydrogenase large subunit